VSGPTIPVLRLPASSAAPRDAMRAGARSSGLPYMLHAGTETERWQLLRAELPRDAMGDVEGKLLAIPAVTWVGGCGTLVLTRDGSPFVATVARVRTRAGAWCAVWAGEKGDGEPLFEWDDTAGPCPRWLSVLFPTPTDGPVTLMQVDMGPPPAIRPPDAVVPVPKGASAADVVRLAGIRLEAQLVSSGNLVPVVGCWRDAEIRLWWGRDVGSLAPVVGGDPNITGAIVWEGVQEGAVLTLRLVLESHGNAPIAWVRRAHLDGNRARWHGDGAIEPHAAVGLLQAPLNVFRYP
jgi:hypothetical protein